MYLQSHNVSSCVWQSAHDAGLLHAPSACKHTKNSNHVHSEMQIESVYVYVARPRLSRARSLRVTVQFGVIDHDTQYIAHDSQSLTVRTYLQLNLKPAAAYSTH